MDGKEEADRRAWGTVGALQRRRCPCGSDGRALHHQDGTAATLYGFDERNSPKGDLMDNTSTGWTSEGLQAWGKALVKTGVEHLDLGLARQGKQALADTAAPPATVPPKA